ncbi:hypothetical protein SK224_05700 [Microbacterium sp. BG28]|uniref:hypothetical protein n=1 Tax=Microbacterium sp. BG28 TaxID=3097356 RepID=UPI002A5AA0CC|nr:hypothetical protein [Microbacterium sp. BG28]MDY0828618.1 hypothetical protein [Microbacterium sp. BG28]
MQTSAGARTHRTFASFPEEADMDETQRMAMAGIHTLERELIVRDFITVLNEGQLCDIALPGARTRCLTGFGSFRLDELRIAAWHQVFA